MMVSLSDVPLGQPQPLTTGVTCSDTDIEATPFVVPPSPDIEQPCIQLHDSQTCGLPEPRQPWLLWNLLAISVNRIVFLPAYRWKPSIGIAASSCSAIRRHGMSECCSVSILSAPPGSIVVHLRHTCSCSRMDVGYCCSPIQHDDCAVTVVV